MIAILDHQVITNPQPEDAGTITLIATVEGYDPTFTITTFLEEFINEEDCVSKENLNYFLMDSGINDNDIANGIVELMTYVNEVTSLAGNEYFPGCALNVGLSLVYGDHQVDEAVQPLFQENNVIHFNPTSEFVIEDLPRGLYDKPNDDTHDEKCTICLDEYENGERVVVLPCEHYYHEECTVTWLRTSHLCPLCRFELL